jgi:hypothetical protein
LNLPRTSIYLFLNAAADKKIYRTKGVSNENYHSTGPVPILEFSSLTIRVGKKAGNTRISQDGGKYWEIRLILFFFFQNTTITTYTCDYQLRYVLFILDFS